MLLWYLLAKMVYILYGQNQHDWINAYTLGKGVLQSNLLPSAVRVNRFCGMFKCVRQALQWRYDEHDGVSTHQPYDCLLNHLFRRRSQKAAKLRVTGLCTGNSTVDFPAQRSSNAENVSIWWRHHGFREEEFSAYGWCPFTNVSRAPQII